MFYQQEEYHIVTRDVMLSKIVLANVAFMYSQNFEGGDFKRLWVNEKHIIAGEEHVVRRGFVYGVYHWKRKEAILMVDVK